ncbi:hypothetical protein [Streptomyces sp. NPDC058595]|uniref:hypothetical protein n=1 Tax=Streptomyces sp. NPDC058595 TaxID=3346550 RepID=UPI00364F2858
MTANAATGLDEADPVLISVGKENAQLRRANDVLRTASAFFAAQLDPTRPR